MEEADGVMDDNARATQGGEPEPVVHWRAVLTPYRSLPPLGFLIVMSVLGGVSFVTGVAFAWMGAWPVLGFFGLDVLIVYIAFKVNYRAGRMVETVEIGQPDVVLTRVHPSGRREQFALNAYWAKVQLREHHNGSTTLSVGSHGDRLSFGAFLTDDERRDLASAMSAALADARQRLAT
jgi:uncharacterized membrane protein